MSSKQPPSSEAAGKKEANSSYPVQSVIPVRSFADFQVNREDVIRALQQDAVTIHDLLLSKVGTENE